MFCNILKGKIHRAVVTEADVHYMGSIAIDPDLKDGARILDNEVVHVYNITNGERFSTYAIPGKRGSGDICINGAAAHCAREGDLVIIACYAHMPEEQAQEWKPHLVFVDGRNRRVPLESAVAPGQKLSLASGE